MDSQTRASYEEFIKGALKDRINESMKVIMDGVRIGIVDANDLIGKVTQLMVEQRAENEEEDECDTNEKCVVPRHCQVCTITNASIRFGLIGCNHYCCSDCAKKLTENSKRIACPYCPKGVSSVRMREDEQKKSEVIVENVKNTTKTTSTIRRLVRCILPYV